MEFAHLITFNIALLAAIVSPGPAFLIAVQNTLSSGKRAGIATGIGLGFVGALWATAALLGLDAIFTLFPWAYVIIKTVGALYLLYIAYCMWQGSRDPIKADVKPTSHALKQGMMINILNPKTVLFAAAVLAVIFPSNMTFFENGIIIANHFVFEVLFYSILAFGMSRKAVSEGYVAVKFYIDRIGAAALGLLGGRLLLNR
jgi:threonine/homoserine/homoserine lactone efflux protein